MYKKHVHVHVVIFSKHAPKVRHINPFFQYENIYTTICSC